MDERATPSRAACSGPARSESAIDIAGLRVVADTGVGVASLRYFSADGPFARAVQRVTGLALPGVLRAVGAPHPGPVPWILAWRSPTEALAISAAATPSGPLVELATAVAECADGCLVDQTGGQCVLRVSGRLVRDLLIRLGSTASIPAMGESRRSRLADVPVVAVCVQAGETLLIVERVYREHLLAWIREISADLAAPV